MPENLCYQEPFQSIPWQSELFHRSEEEEKHCFQAFYVWADFQTLQANISSETLKCTLIKESLMKPHCFIQPCHETISPEAAKAQVCLLDDLFRGKEFYGSFLSVLQSLRVTIMQFINQPQAITSTSSLLQTSIQFASSLAKSAIQYRDQAQNLNVFFNIEQPWWLDS